MTLEQIKAELSRLPEEQQDHLAAYLVHLRHQRDSAVQTDAEGNANEAQWVSLDRLKEEWED